MVIIALEGIDGCGKSTQLHRVAESLRDRVVSELTVTTMKFPVYEGSKTGEILQAMLNRGLSSKDSKVLFQSLMAVNRAEAMAPLRYSPNHIVLLDRYILSGIVYGLAQELDLPWLAQINSFLPPPDVTVFLDVPPSVSFERRPDRRDFMEKDRSFLERTYKLYKEHLPFGSFIIDGLQGQERVTDEIVGKILLVNESLTYKF